MGRFPHRGCGALAVACFVAVLAVWPSVASASLTIDAATVDGKTNSSSSPPGGVLKASLTVDASGGDTWRGTEYRFGNQGDCVNTSDGDKNDTNTRAFNVTAPGKPGDYDAGFTATTENDCGGTTSSEKVLQDALNVTAPRDNPNLPPRCGINVMLVLDESGSIDTSGATEAVRSATRSFLNALSGTGAQVSIIDFSTSAQQQVPYTTVTPDTITNDFNPYLDNEYDPAGWTNWEDAFSKVQQANADPSQPDADLVVFITDGDPTARNRPGENPETGLDPGAVAALRPAAFEADLVKAQGSHVFALGVGAAVTKPESARRLTAISGFDQYPGAEFSEADYTLVEDFDDLAAALRKIALELCEASVTITKLVDEGDGVYRPDPGWEFTASVSMSEGDYRWVQPAPPPAQGERTASTNDAGVATFQWKPSNSGASSTITISEAVKPGYQFVDAVCDKAAPGRKRARRRYVPLLRTGNPSATGTLGPNQYAKCTVRNRIMPGPTTGVIEIEKSANPQSEQAFPFSGSLGAFSLVDDGIDATTSSRTFPDLQPGTYTVSELVPENWALTGLACTPAAAAAITGAQAVITLAAGGAVVCTYSDTRTNPPAPPEPPEPPPGPPPPGPPQPPTPPTPQPSTVLRVVKTAPRTARAGQRVRFRLRVTNVGSVAASRVRMADVPPAALALTALRSSVKAHRVRRYAVWNLGTLEPGQSRTVRGSVRIKSGTPGWKRNIVLATAVNANLVADRADTRLRRARRAAAPPVTG